MLLLLLPAISWAQQRPPVAEQMAKTYGLDSFGQIEGIRYTFNAELSGVELSRTWEWNPKTDTVSYEGKDKASAERVMVKYPSEGGYAPGDTWELYVGGDKRVEEMIYHRGGTQEPSVVIATWVDYKKAGPLLISTDHRGTADGQPLRVSFSDVSVKVTGSENWTNAQ